MCVVSAITQSIPNNWGSPQNWPAQTVIDVDQILKKLDAIDKKLGAPECTDPNKDKFLADLERRVKALEADRRERNILR